jgi:hypothetical protein
MIPPNTETPRGSSAGRPDIPNQPLAKDWKFQINGSMNISQFVRKVNDAALSFDKGGGHAGHSKLHRD